MNRILHRAISLNGMVARENDDTDFLAHDNWDIFVELAHQTGAMILGRKTHEIVRTYGEQFIRMGEADQGSVTGSKNLQSAIDL